jgi:type VII secretion protein EccE
LLNQLDRHPSARREAATGILLTRVLPLTDLLLTQACMIAGAGISLAYDGSALRGALAGLVVALGLVVRLGGRSVRRRIEERLGFWYERTQRGRRPPHRPPFDIEQPNGRPIGFQWDGSILTSLVRIAENPHTISVLGPAGAAAGATIPLEVAADCLRQFDITLDRIDVICHGARIHDSGHLGAVYDAVLGPLPAIAQRSVFVAVRFDPAKCPEAIRRRGGGWDGLTRAGATATRRIANRLSDSGLLPEIMTADEICSATDTLLDGAQLTDVRESWETCQNKRFQLRGFYIQPAMFNASVLDSLWAAQSYSTTLAVSLRRDERNTLVGVRGLVRFANVKRDSVRLPELGKLPGRQYAALLATLPVPAHGRAIDRFSYARDAEDFGNLELPAFGCGQVVGADEYGRAVAVPLFGPWVRRVDMCGTLHLAQQVVLRSLALGACAHVETDRPEAWAPMAAQVGNAELLRINHLDSASTRVDSGRRYDVQIYDGTRDPRGQEGMTTMVVKPAHTDPSPDADISLQLIDSDRNVVQIVTRMSKAVVMMVATDDEMRYIRGSLDAR